MKTLICKLTIFLLLFMLFACEKNENKPNYASYIDYLSDKAIVSIQIYDGNIWILSSKECDTCYVAPYMSFYPRISQLTMVNDSNFEYEEPTLVSVPVCKNSQGILYTGSENKILKINSFKNYETILETGDFYFNNFKFDKNNNIWLSGNDGIAFWNGTNLKIYNKNNSELPADITYGLVIDNADNVWVALDFKGLLKISNNTWKIIPNSEIPGLNSQSYLLNPILDNENNIWFNVFSPDTTSSIVKFDGENWIYEYPNQNGSGAITIDSNGKIWVIDKNFENNSFINSTLTYLQNGEWINFNVSMIDNMILTVNSNDKYTYVGTIEGLKIIEK